MALTSPSTGISATVGNTVVSDAMMDDRSDDDRQPKLNINVPRGVKHDRSVSMNDGATNG